MLRVTLKVEVCQSAEGRQVPFFYKQAGLFVQREIFAAKLSLIFLYMVFVHQVRDSCPIEKTEAVIKDRSKAQDFSFLLSS